MRVDRIDRTDVLNLHSELAKQPYVANRAVAVMSAIMTFAERLDHRKQQTNPCRGVERFKEKKRKRPLTSKELAALWAHLDLISPSSNPYVIGAIRVLLLTGMRREEVLTLAHSDVDRDAGLINLRDAKTGPRTVVLSAEALRVITSLPVLDGNPYVFPGAKEGQRLVNISDTWQAIRRDLDFPEVRIHDFRHTVASMLARSAPLIVVRDALGHSEISTTADYSHASQTDVRAAINILATAISGGECNESK